jgi:hypothetical protein
LPALTVTVTPSAVAEGQSATGRVRITVAIVQPVTVRLVKIGAAAADVTIPADVTIQPGQTSAEFPVTIASDAVVDGDQEVSLIGVAANYESGAASLLVLDARLRVISANAAYYGLFRTLAGETEGLAVASSVEVEFDAVVGDAVAVIDALTPAFGVAAGETVALAVAFDDVVGDVVAVAVALAEPAAVDEGDAEEGVALVELSAALGLAAADRVGDAVAVAVALLVEFEPAALAGDNVGVAETVSVAETVGVAVRVAETVGVAEASAPTPLSVMPALT